jgi:hypothetical protein
MLLHYSAWPFKPDHATALTVEGLSIALALLTGGDRFYICFEDRHSKSYTYERPRNWVDRIRLLFQSLCSNVNWAEEASQNCRADGDDEDLVAVLHESMPQRQKLNRERFLPVAATLPSSYSTKVAKEVPFQSIQALLELLLIAGTLRHPSSVTNEREALRGTAKAVAYAFPKGNTTIGWGQFTESASNVAVRYSPSRISLAFANSHTSRFYLLS